MSKKIHFETAQILKDFQGKLPPTPFYFYKEDILQDVWENFSSAFQNTCLPVESRFPLKANNNRHVLEFFFKRGGGADVVSGGELRLALEQGVAPEKIIFSGVGKSDEELRLAVNSEIGMLCIESRSEILRLERICRDLGKKARIAFRVNPNVDAKTHPYISTGLHDHKFGLEIPEALSLYKHVLDSKFLRAWGLSMHIGSQIRDLKVYDEAANEVLDFAQTLKELGARLKVLDLGGGLGIDYSQPLVMADFSNYAKVFETSARRWQELYGAEETMLLTECGRALVAQCGFLVTHVIATKHGKTQSFAILDASMTELMRPSLYQSEHPAFRLEQKSETPSRKWQFVGPVCESADILIKSVELGDIDEGEAFVFYGAGAYGYVMSNQYNARSIPAEWWAPTEGAPQCSRERRPFVG